MVQAQAPSLVDEVVQRLPTLYPGSAKSILTKMGKEIPGLSEEVQGLSAPVFGGSTPGTVPLEFSSQGPGRDAF